METVLIDTNIIIGRVRNEPRALTALAKVEGSSLVICDAVLAEVLSGARNKTEYDATFRELNQQFHSLPFTMVVSRHFRDIMGYHARDNGVHFAVTGLSFQISASPANGSLSRLTSRSTSSTKRAEMLFFLRRLSMVAVRLNLGGIERVSLTVIALRIAGPSYVNVPAQVRFDRMWPESFLRGA